MNSLNQELTPNLPESSQLQVPIQQGENNKLASLFKSRRFWAALASLLGIIIAHVSGIDATTIEKIVLVVSAWIVGDSLRVTN